MMNKLLLALVLSCSIACATPVQFRYERDLIQMFDNPKEHYIEEREAMADCVLAWMRQLLHDHATGRVKISKEDEEYMFRMSIMACGILNWREIN